MSASEKMRAHGGRFVFREGEGQASYIELSYWPQIVAVVEAAEVAFREYEAENPFIGYSLEAIGPHLAALDWALS